jgi:hypothetical protein
MYETVIAAIIGAGAPSIAIWYKLGKVEQKVRDLPCRDNGVDAKKCVESSESFLND